MPLLKTPDGDDLLNFLETRAAFDARAGGLDHFGLHLPRGRYRRVLHVSRTPG